MEVLVIVHLIYSANYFPPVDTSLPSTKMLHNPKIAGMALYLTIYCKRKGKILHLEDLFVKEEHRSK